MVPKKKFAQRGCFACGQLGHLARYCSNNTTSGSGEFIYFFGEDVVKVESLLYVTVVEDVGINRGNVLVRLSFVVQGVQGNLVSIVARSQR